MGTLIINTADLVGDVFEAVSSSGGCCCCGFRKGG